MTEEFLQSTEFELKCRAPAETFKHSQHINHSTIFFNYMLGRLFCSTILTVF
jgi:hypothetical protein